MGLKGSPSPQVHFQGYCIGDSRRLHLEMQGSRFEVPHSNSDVFWFIQITKSMFLFQTKSDKEIQELDNYLISISIRMLQSLSDSSAMLSPGDHTADAPPAGVSACSSMMAVGATYQICKSKDDKDNMLLCDWCDKGYSIYCVVPPSRMFLVLSQVS